MEQALKIKCESGSASSNLSSKGRGILRRNLGVSLKSKGVFMRGYQSGCSTGRIG